MASEVESDSDDIKFLKLVMSANDESHHLWPEEAVDFAKRVCHKNWQRVPSLSAALNNLGEERFIRLSDEIRNERLFYNSLLGHGSPCHYCGAPSNLLKFEFALMRVEASSRNWGASVATMALGAVTFPLLGGAVLQLPKKELGGGAFKLKLVVCKDCIRKHGNWLGLFMINEERASHHPLWNSLREAGFTKFLEGKNIPLGLNDVSSIW